VLNAPVHDAFMSTATSPSRPDASSNTRALLNKVPEVTLWFWIIKILCTTVGESFADWVSVDLGVGLINTSLIFTVVLAAVLVWQLTLPRYNPFPYWLTVVVLSVTGTLYTDILTDKYGVPLALSTSVFAVLLAVVFGVWYAREGTLSIHSIVTRRREAFYWTAILVTFALGTAAGDWTLELTGWTPGVSVLLPIFLIVSVIIGWRMGANPVLSFWLAYILTRPLGANMGDWLALSNGEGGLGLGTAVTSVIFLSAILATVIYLVIKKPDVIENVTVRETEGDPARRRKREHAMLWYYGLVGLVAVTVLVIANHRPHAAAAAEDANGAPVVHLTPQQATANLPAADLTQFRTISQDTLDLVASGHQAAATSRIADLESAWDDDQSRLEPLDETAWNFFDQEIDAALTAVRASNPDTTAEQQALGALITSLTS
jgi:uncharacterized membrane-anchored protein